VSDTRILIAEYEPCWPELFRREAARIRAALGGHITAIEHAGSTSVPGLPAKSVVDIILAVVDSSDETAYVPRLQAAGYVLRIREPEWHQHRLFKGPDTDINLHVFSAGCPEIARMLLFRDWLRSHPDDRDRYARTKLALAEQTWQSVDDYANAKTAVIEEILKRASEH
jgi:GrpB-like predicted nucleotidyltransferase (UPF0157 family)